MIEPCTIRPFETTEEYHECVALQEATWGGGFTERVSPAILQVAQILGGISAGAYDASGRLVGFVFGLTGVRDGRVVHWSDMLAVRPELRDAGLGRRLKAYQRAQLLSRGIDTMFWTFDPLQSRNAHLNITRLGAIVREYRINMYGDTDSPLHRGIGTDRFVASWLMDTERVRARLAGVEPEPLEEAPFALDAEGAGTGDHPRPGLLDLSLRNGPVRVAIPSGVDNLMDADLELAVAWRTASRAVFEHYFAAGYEVTGFARGEPTSSYYLTKAMDQE